MNRIIEIENEIASLRKERATIQEECCHPPSVLMYKRGDNNPDPLQEVIEHIDYDCGLCGKTWRETL